MPTVPSAEGVAIATHDLGGRGRDLLLSHAAGFHGRVWLPLARALEGSFHCLSYDVRGHGDSEVAGDVSFDWRDLAGDVLAVVDGLGLARPLGLGHSSGATALLLAEAHRPGTFAALYCIEPIGPTTDEPSPPAPDHPMAVRARRRRDVFASRAEAAAVYRDKRPLSDLAPDALHAYVEHGFATSDDGTVRLACRPENEARMYAHGFAHDAFRRLPDVRCPVVLARGGASTTIGDEALARWAERLPQGRTEVLGGLGHLAPLEDPSGVASAVAAALAPFA